MDVKIYKRDQAYIQVVAQPSIKMELCDHFTFDVPGASFSPKFRNRQWDGIGLLNSVHRRYIRWTLPYVLVFCEKMSYEVELCDNFSSVEFSIKEAGRFYQRIGTNQDSS